MSSKLDILIQSSSSEEEEHVLEQPEFTPTSDLQHYPEGDSQKLNRINSLNSNGLLQHSVSGHFTPSYPLQQPNMMHPNMMMSPIMQPQMMQPQMMHPHMMQQIMYEEGGAQPHYHPQLYMPPKMPYQPNPNHNSRSEFTLAIILPNRTDCWFDTYRSSIHPDCSLNQIVSPNAVDVNKHSIWEFTSSSLLPVVDSVIMLAKGIAENNAPPLCVGRTAEQKVSFRVLIPAKLAFRMIGVKGATIQIMRDSLDCDVFVSQTAFRHRKILCLVANTEGFDRLHSALKLVCYSHRLLSNGRTHQSIMAEAKEKLTEKEFETFAVIGKTREEQEYVSRPPQNMNAEQKQQHRQPSDSTSLPKKPELRHSANVSREVFDSHPHQYHRIGSNRQLPSKPMSHGPIASAQQPVPHHTGYQNRMQNHPNPMMPAYDYVRQPSYNAFDHTWNASGSMEFSKEQPSSMTGVPFQRPGSMMFWAGSGDFSNSLSFQMDSPMRSPRLMDGMSSNIRRVNSHQEPASSDMMKSFMRSMSGELPHLPPHTPVAEPSNMEG